MGKGDSIAETVSNISGAIDIELCKSISANDVDTSVATGSGHPDHPGQPGHNLPRSTGSDPLYTISGFDLDFA